MDFPSNSKNVTGKSTPKAKEEKKLQKVVTGDVIKVKKPLGQRFKLMVTGIEFRGATQYVFFDVLVPAVKNMVVDAVDVGVKRMIYGDSPSRNHHSGHSRTTYNAPINRGRDSVMLPKQPPYSQPRGVKSSTDVVLSSREEAELVLTTMQDIIEKYKFASVSDFNTILGQPSTYVDNNWGWSGLQYVDIRQAREGWLLYMPSVEPIQ